MSGRPTGVLGGTFDPVHRGHLKIAETARNALGLEEVWFLPCAVPPHKPAERHASAEHREAMVRLALEDRVGLEICTLELESGDVCFTIDSLRHLTGPPYGCAPVFLVGLDSLLDLPTWHGFPALIEEFDLAVVDRRGETTEAMRKRMHPDVASRLRAVSNAAVARPSPGSGGRIFHLPMSPVQVSSSQVRSHAALGRNLDDLVPPEVARYILRNGLYRQEDRN